MKSKKELRSAVASLIKDLKKPENSGQEESRGSYIGICFRPSVAKSTKITGIMDVLRLAIFQGVQGGHSTVPKSRDLLKKKGLESFASDFDDLVFSDLEEHYKESEALNAKASEILSFCSSKDKQVESLSYFVNPSQRRGSDVLGLTCRAAIVDKVDIKSIDADIDEQFDKLNNLKKEAKEKIEKM